jgi:hypothetical protein
MRELTLYEDYSREDVHDILDPETTFTPQAGTWGLQGIISVPKRQRDFVFFVTFGQKQATHEFDEWIRLGMPLTQGAPTDCGLAFRRVGWTIRA